MDCSIRLARTTHAYHYLSLYRLTRWHMHTDRPSFNYTYTANILAYTHTYTCTHIAHALLQAMHSFHETHTRTVTHTHTHAHTCTHTYIYTHTHTHTLCQSFTINGLDRHTRSSSKDLHNMGCL